MPPLPTQVADENVPPAAAAGGASKKQKASNIRTSWGGAASHRARPSSTQAAGKPATANPLMYSLHHIAWVAKQVAEVLVTQAEHIVAISRLF